MIKYDDLYIVGIGASAGGFEAFQKFLTHLSRAKNITYILVQHLDPKQPTLLGELLSKVSPYPIVPIINGETIEAQKIYYCPPNNDVTIKDGQLFLTKPENKFFPKPSINKFLSSLAKEKKDKAVGIILSGSGTDGAVGIEAIAEHGGIALSEDEGAKYYSMPKAAIDTGKVLAPLPPELLADGIPHIIKDRNYFEKHYLVRDSMDKILTLLNQRTNIDFTSYKEPTIIRRIKKKINETKSSSVDDYYALLQKDSSEIEKLKDELLILVTSFFRDKEAFVELKEDLRTLLLKQQKETLRVWVTGCATGEEAYSIAIILSELFEELSIKKKTTIFATDVSEANISLARNKYYNEDDVREIDHHLLEKYFENNYNSYRPIKGIRDMIVFSKHDIIKDPPFLNIDLISCRNLLIYFNNELQKRILSIFYYSLGYESLLFLGKSETVGNLNALFSILSNKHKIYKKSNDMEKIDVETLTYVKKTNLSHVIEKKDIDSKPLEIDFAINKSISNKFGRSGIVLNGKNNSILYYRGDTRDFLNQPSGMQTNDIFQLLVDYLKLDFRATFNEAQKTKHFTESKKIRVMPVSEPKEYVVISIFPLEKNKLGEDTYFIIFNKHIDFTRSLRNDVFEPIDLNKNEVNLLEDELVTLKERLQITIEELETSNEELQSTNEELQSTNEELQSTNEELETSNEELQSTNEELQTVNDEFLFANLELEFANKAFNNILEALEAHVLILDNQLNVIKYTDGIRGFFNMSKNFETNFSTILLNSSIELPDLMRDIKASLQTNKQTSYDISYNNRSYSFSISKVDISVDKTDNLKEAIVLSFVDKTNLMKNEQLMFQQSKMASMGEMIGNIAHQWRQPLNTLSATILKHSIMCKKHNVEEELIEEFKEKTNRLIQKMSTTIDDFRSFFRPNKEKEPFSIEKVVKEALKFIDDSYANNNITLVNKVETQTVIMGFKNELIQVLLNILNNSKDAIKAKGIAKGEVSLSLEEDTSGVILSIIDNGGGIDEKIIDNVFEPYFTTKFQDAGTGIGLYMSKMIIEESLGGTMKLENIKDGVKASIYLKNSL